MSVCVCECVCACTVYVVINMIISTYLLIVGITRIAWLFLPLKTMVQFKYLPYTVYLLVRNHVDYKSIQTA